MSSRHDEKERRKQERIEREAAAAQQAKRKRLLQIVAGAVAALAVVGGIGYAVANGGGGETDDGRIDAARLTAAAKAAGCTYRSFPSEGAEHLNKKFTAADYKTNPPTSGNHLPPGMQAPDGLYVAGNEPEIGAWVHTLEHGRIIFQYRPGVAKSVVTQLEALFREDVKGSGGAYHSVLMRNNTDMPFQVAAVAWRHYMACKTFTPKAIEALREFREEVVDTAPERVP